ncbi:unnamed protein product [Cylicostephanus goldi]|uniref:Sushi domain-containing protein n=1 Tax=Cylicostephanus goldi TaxID=71465 RepID=A0A3P6QSP3_CYLGO|nr:unnamed protein product [Cylicostephanus goldi]
MRTVVIFSIFIIVFADKAEGSCDPLPDDSQARIMYHMKNKIVVRPKEQLDDGAVAKLRCHPGAEASGQSTVTCVSGKWDGALGSCA